MLQTSTTSTTVSETSQGSGAQVPSAQDLFYVVNVSHGNRERKYISVWRPENKGYAYPLSWAGRYSRAQIEGSLYYFNGGENVSVPCAVLDAVAVSPEAGQVDGDAGPVVANTKANWGLILASLIAKPDQRPKPIWLRQRPRERKLLQPVLGGWSTRQSDRVPRDATTTAFQKRILLALGRAPNKQGSTERLANALDSRATAVLVAARSLEGRGIVSMIQSGKGSGEVWCIVDDAKPVVPAGLDFSIDGSADDDVA